MGESHLFSRIMLSPQYCSFCSGSPTGKKGEDCKYYPRCLDLVSPGFEIPQDKEKIETYVKNYNEGKPLYEIAQIIWEEEDPDKIKEKANRVDIDTVEPFPDILSMPLGDGLDEKHVKNKVKELKECAQGKRK